jgi:hypothetical protein
MDLLVCVKLEVPADDFAGWQQLMEMAGLFDQTILCDRAPGTTLVPGTWYARAPVVQTISHAAPEIVWACQVRIRGELPAIPL